MLTLKRRSTRIGGAPFELKFNLLGSKLAAGQPTRLRPNESERAGPISWLNPIHLVGVGARAHCRQLNLAAELNTRGHSAINHPPSPRARGAHFSAELAQRVTMRIEGASSPLREVLAQLGARIACPVEWRLQKLADARACEASRPIGIGRHPFLLLAPSRHNYLSGRWLRNYDELMG